MTEYDRILTASLDSYLNNKDFCSSFDADTARLLIKRSREQKVLPVIYLKNSQELQSVLPEGEFAGLKREIMLSVSLQLQRSAELVRICRILESNGIEYIVFKGAVCRSLYDKPEYRTSSDEDLLVAEEKIDKAKSLLLNDGYVIADEKKSEIKLINPRIKAFVELHSSIVNSSASEQMKQIGDSFISQLDNPFRVSTEAGSINTFNPTYGFLALCIHFYNHFVIGGIGIRPVMDIACFIKSYSNEIDFDYCFSVLETVSAEKMIKTVISLCVRCFGIESEYAADGKSADRLLSDILDAGAFGTSDSGRNHSGTVTKVMTNSGKGVVSTALSALIPSEDEIVSVHPELKGKSGEIRKYRVRRIINFAGEGGKIKAIKTAEKRRRLLKELGIAKSKHNREE